MQLSTRGRYAVMAMLDLAQMSQTSDSPITLAQIAERQRISLSYLEQLFAKLRKAGVVASLRGPGGGYTIAKPLAQVWMADIMAAVEEDTDITRCKSMYKLQPRTPGEGCAAGGQCNAHGLWEALSKHIDYFLARVNLQMVLDGDVGLDFSVLGAVGEGTKVVIN